jgi:hypothetical protein
VGATPARRRADPREGVRARPRSPGGSRAVRRQAQDATSGPPGMKQIHVWRNHIRIPHLDLVLIRPAPETLADRLERLARLGFDVRPGNVELHDGAPAS